jgi:hypothetical protein
VPRTGTLYDAKQAGGDREAFYATSEHRSTRSKRKLTWVNRIERVLEEDRFALLPQPILDLHTGEVPQQHTQPRTADASPGNQPPKR